MIKHVFSQTLNVTIKLSILTLTFVVSSMSPVFAHHSSAPHFDKDKEIIVSGTITELKLVNPHSYLYFDVEVEGETVNWRCELSSATQLRRWNWSKDVFPVGEKITMNGNPARREDNVCFMNSLTLASGQVINRSGDLSDSNSNVETAKIEQRPSVLANGQPNLQGPWVTKSFGRRAVEGTRARFEATEAGKAASQGYEMAFDDPILQCHFVNILNGWNHDENVNDIIQSENEITLQYGFMDLARTVHLNINEHPQNLKLSDAGYSIGRWDGDVLIVHTKGFTEGILSHQSGMKHSNQMEVVERFSFDENKQRLYRDYTVTDPLYLVGEAKGQDAMALSSEPYSPYGCVELSGKNNLRTSDARYNQVDSSGVIATGAGVLTEQAVETATGNTESSEVEENVIEQQDSEADKSWWQFW